MARRRSGRAAAVTLVLVATIVLAAGVWVATTRYDAPARTASPGAVPQRPDDAVALTVVSVWDGDTLRAVADRPNDLIDTAEEIRIRLIGIDTPERSPDECGALPARDHLRALLPPGSTVWVAPDDDPFDRYDRRLFYLWTVDGRFVNYELVAAGDAESLRVEPNTTYDALFASAMATAQSAELGRWGACD